jgi:hypothetical protein
MPIWRTCAPPTQPLELALRPAGVVGDQRSGALADGTRARFVAAYCSRAARKCEPGLPSRSTQLRYQ